MRWRTGPDGYGLATKLLHWGTVVLLVVQPVVGLRLTRDEDGRAQLLGVAVDLFVVHVTIGMVLLATGVLRIFWRRFDGFPDWSPSLGPGERRLVHGVERGLVALLVLVPLTGVVLVATGDDDWLPLHLTGHAALLLALALHLFTNLRPTVLRRML